MARPKNRHSKLAGTNPEPITVTNKIHPQLNASGNKIHPQLNASGNKIHRRSLATPEEKAAQKAKRLADMRASAKKANAARKLNPDARRGSQRVGGTGQRVHQISQKQFDWINEYVKTGSVGKAAAFVGVSGGLASEWKRKPLIIDEIEKIRAIQREKTGYGLEEAMVECEEGIAFAKDTKNANAFMKGLELKAKLNGLLIEKHDHRMIANFSINVQGVRDSLPSSPAQLTSGEEEKMVIGDSTVEETVIGDSEEEKTFLGSEEENEIGL